MTVAAAITDVIIDPAELLSRVDGDTAFLIELLGIFLAESPRLLSKIRNAVIERDSMSLELCAHSLKGSAGNLTARAVFRLSQELERMGCTGDLTGSDAACAALEEEVDRLRDELDRLRTVLA